MSRANRIDLVFDDLKQRGRKGVIPYITAGFPSLAETVDLLITLADAGADVIELGVPFSDPMADGPVIQKAHEVALAQGASLRFVLDCVSQFRQQNKNTPIVLMGYANPMFKMGLSVFIDEAARAGVDGVLTVDLPPEESDEYVQIMQKAALKPIFLLSPTSDESRLRLVNEVASGFVYYVSLKGVTGAGASGMAQWEAGVEKIKTVRSALKTPMVVGFGIKTPEDARRFDAVSDAVVIGSELIRLLDETPSTERLAAVKVWMKQFVNR
jgi:tryptophan synthase alpha chain